jgi:hypothetical protein
MEDNQVERRFDRLEGKIDRLSEVLASVARVEENERKIEEIGDVASTNRFVAKIGTGIVATVWTVILGAVVYFFKGDK